MAVKFDLHEKPRTNAAETVSYIPKLVSAGTVTLKQLCREISSGNSITPGDVKAVVSALCEHMSQHLSDGCTIDLDDLGTFRLSLKSKKPIDYFDDNTAARQLALSRII
ncbi:MAG: HU family DNA-binding protein, partial [Alloprevotella sp.]|nr:HU family DNA-binding protein [Alloprevotella sp.]